MSRLLVIVALIAALLGAGATAQSTDRPLARAMDALRDGNWAAAQIEARGDGQVALDVILWHKLRAGNGSARQYLNFLDRNPDWPGLPFLREKGEITLAEASHDAVLGFFAQGAPETGSGALSLARAHLSRGDRALAESVVVRAWRELAMSAEEQSALLSEWRDVLSPHFVARLDMALWRGWAVNARRVVPLVGEDWQKLAEARLALRADAPGVDTLIAAVPEALADHPGLAFERFRWRARKNRDDAALELLLARSETAQTLGEPEVWASRRRGYARQYMRAGDYAKAYEIASKNGLSAGSAYADLEWLSGYLSLRFLEAPERALQHFTNHRNAVATPISLGRAGYWRGRAYRAMGRQTPPRGPLPKGPPIRHRSTVCWPPKKRVCRSTQP